MDLEAEIKDIEFRWKDNLHAVCEDCMYTCIRHQDRNVGCQFEEEERKHPKRYDGELYATAGKDIKTLLDIIKELKKKL
jgi:hypothetical protein